MDVRTSSKNYDKFKKYFEKNREKYFRDKSGNIYVTITLDENAIIPVVMVRTIDGMLVEWTRGYKNVKLFLKHGYVKLIKKCPFKLFGILNCSAERCQLYMIRNNTGDCSLTWNAILKYDRG